MSDLPLYKLEHTPHLFKVVLVVFFSSVMLFLPGRHLIDFFDLRGFSNCDFLGEPELVFLVIAS